MFRLIKKIDNIHSLPLFHGKQLFMYDKDYNFLCYNENTLTLDYFLKLDYDYFFVIHSNNPCFYMNNGIYMVINCILTNIWNSKNGHPFIFNDFIIESEYNRTTKLLSLWGYKQYDNNPIWHDIFEERFSQTIKNDLLLSDLTTTHFSYLNVVQGRIEWTIDFGLKVHGDILKFGDTLIIPLDNNHLLGINAATGEKLWELEDCFNYNKLDDKTGLLYGYGAERYEIINAATGEKVLRKQFEGSRDKYYISVVQHMTVLSEDSLYFTSTRNGQSKFGKINIKTHEIEFVQDLGVEEGVQASTPVYHNGRLYIKDSVGVLHIFEEE